MEIDLEEMTRLDVDGSPAYSAEELLDGEVVIRNENYGYWNSDSIDGYANPFFAKLTRELWRRFPHLLVLGECWGGYLFENRGPILARSGVVPRLFKLPQVLCGLFGKRLHKDGRLTVGEERQDVTQVKRWFEEGREMMPRGSVLVQSSTAHSWPYPAYLYGKGAWAAVDTLFFMPDLPITFMDEVNGHAFRVSTTQIY